MTSNWQEKGLRLGGAVLDSQDAQQIVQELCKRVKDPAIHQEIDAFLTCGAPLSQKTRDALLVILAGIVMQQPKS